jgi:NADP-dependent 3-hydroxy acid dehydrogenase YdfG
MSRLNGKFALITGSTTGIGFASFVLGEEMVAYGGWTRIIAT